MHLRWSPVIPSLIITIIVVQFWVVSFKVALSSALKATIALLIIVVVVTVVVIVVSRPYPTVPGQMANPIA
ncbi:hypothetical protein Tco_0429999, partial [Tanacetum coccineum]